MSVVFDFNASLNDDAPVSPILFPVDVKKMERSNLMMNVLRVSSFFCLHHSDWVQWVLCLISMIHSMMLLLFLQWCSLLMWCEKEEWIVDGCILCIFFLLSSLPKLSVLSVVFDFSDSLNDDTPVSPMLLPVDRMRKEKEWIVDGCLLCVFFLLSSLLRLSSVSVVFDFNDSLNDFTPVSPMLLSVDNSISNISSKPSKDSEFMVVFLMPDLSNQCIDTGRKSSQVQHAQSCVLHWHVLQKTTQTWAHLLNLLRKHFHKPHK